MHSELHWFFCQAIPVGLQVKAASFCSTGGRDGENGEPDGDWDSNSWPVVPDTEWTKQIV